MKEVVIDGERFVRVDDIGSMKIVVLNRGFVYVGRVEEECEPYVTIHGAMAIIKWGTTKHLGELCNGPLPNTKLGDACTVQCHMSQVIHTIEVNENDWRS